MRQIAPLLLLASLALTACAGAKAPTPVAPDPCLGLALSPNADDETLRALLARSRERGCHSVEADASRTLGRRLLNQGNLDEAEPLLLSSVDAAEAGGSPEGAFNAQLLLGRLSEMRADPASAAEIYTDALGQARSLGRRDLEADAAGNLGNAEFSLGKLDQAAELLNWCIEIDRELGRMPGLAGCSGNLGNVEQARGNMEAAGKLYAESLQLHADLGDKRAVAENLFMIGNWSTAMGSLDQAEDVYTDALALFEELGDTRGLAKATGSLGRIAFIRGDLAEAETQYFRSLELHQQLGDQAGEAVNYANLGSLENKRGNRERARELYGKALDLFENPDSAGAVKVRELLRSLDDEEARPQSSPEKAKLPKAKKRGRQ